jgi:hypothetical protein
MMSSTFLLLHYDIVFFTKGRLPLIDNAWCERLHKYLGGTVGGLDGFPQGVGGVADHVHLLVGLILETGDDPGKGDGGSFG